MANSAIVPFFTPKDWDLVSENFSFIWEDDSTFQEKYLGVKVRKPEPTEDLVEESTKNLDPTKYLQQLIAFATAAEHIYKWDSAVSDDGASEHLEAFLDIGLSVLSTIPSIGTAISMIRAGSSNPLMEVVETIRRFIQSPSSIGEEVPQEVIKLVSKDLTKIAHKLIDKQTLTTAATETGIEAEETIPDLLDTIRTGKELTWKTIFAEMILTAPKSTLGEPIARTRQELLGKFGKLSTASLDNIPSNFTDIATAVARDNSLLEPIKKLVSELLDGELLDPQKVSEVLRPGTRGKSKVSILYRVFDEVVSKASQNLINTRLSLESIVSNIAEHASYQKSLQKIQVSLDELETISSALDSEIDILNQIERFAAHLQTYYQISDNPAKPKDKLEFLSQRKSELTSSIEAKNNFLSSSGGGGFSDLDNETIQKRAEARRQLKDFKKELIAVEEESLAVERDVEIHKEVGSKLKVFEAAMETYLQEMTNQTSYYWLTNSVKEVLSEGTKDKKTVREALSELSALRARLDVTLELTKEQCQDVREQRGKYLAAQSINKAVDTAIKETPINEKAPRKVDELKFDKQLGQVFADYLNGIQQLSSSADAGEIDSAAEKYRQVQEKFVIQDEEVTGEEAEKLTVGSKVVLGDKDVRKVAQKVANKHITLQKLNREKVTYQRDYKKLLAAKAKADDVVAKTKQVLENSEGLEELGLQKQKQQIAALEKSIDYGIKLVAAAKVSLHNQQDEQLVNRIKRILPLAQDNWEDTNEFILKQLQEDIDELGKHKKKVDKIIEDAAPYSEKRLANMKQAADEEWTTMSVRFRSDPRSKIRSYRNYEEALEQANTAKYLEETELGEIPLRLEKLNGLKDLLSNANLANALTEQLEQSVDSWLSEYSQAKQEYVSILESNAEKELLGTQHKQALNNEALEICKQRLGCIKNLQESKLFANDELDVLNTVHKDAFLEQEIISLESAVTNDQERLYFLRNFDSRVKGYPVEQSALSKDISTVVAELSKKQGELNKFRGERALKPVPNGDTDNITNNNLLTELRELYAMLRNPNSISQATNPSGNNPANIKENLQKLDNELSSKQEKLVKHDTKLSQSISETKKALTRAETVVKEFQTTLNLYNQVYLPIATSETSATVFANLLRNQFENKGSKEVQVRYQPRAVVEHALRQLASGKRNKLAGSILKGYLEGFTGYKGAGYEGFGGYQGLKAAILNYIADPWLEESQTKHNHKREGNIEGGFQNTIHQLFSYGEPVDAEKISAGLGATLFKLFGDAEYFTVQRVPNQDHPHANRINEIDGQLSETTGGEFWQESFNAKLSSNQIADDAEPVTTLTRVIDVSDVTGGGIKFSFDWLVKGERTSKALILNVRNADTGSNIHTANLRSDGTNEWQHYEESLLLDKATVLKGFGEEVEQLEIFFEIKAGYTGYLDNLALSGTTRVVKALGRKELQQERESLLASDDRQSWRIQYNAELNKDKRKWVTDLLTDVGLQEENNPVKDLMPNGVFNILDPELFYLDNLPDRIINKDTAKTKYASIIAAIEEKSGEFGLVGRAESMLIEMGKREDENITDYSIFWGRLKDFDPVANLSEEFDFDKANIDLAAVLDDFSMQFQPLFEAISKKQQDKIVFELNPEHNLVL